MSDYKPGSRWSSATCGGEFVLVRPPSESGELTCGGQPMRPYGGGSRLTAAAPVNGQGTMAGKRYAEPESGIEILCTKPGAADPAFAGRLLQRKDAKPLPASD